MVSETKEPEGLILGFEKELEDMKKDNDHQLDLFGFNPKEKNWEDLFEEGDPDSFTWKGKYKNEKEEGLWEGFDEKGRLRGRLHYKEGKRHGANQMYWKNGQLGYEVTFQDGKLHGPSLRYWNDGKLDQRVVYKKGKKHGLLEQYYNDGNLYYSDNYIDDKFHGTNERYSSNGHLRERGNWKKGKLHGVMEIFHDNGKIYSIQKFKNGENIRVEFFDEQGFELNRDGLRKGSFYEKIFNFVHWIDPTSPRSLWKKINNKKLNSFMKDKQKDLF